jgi:predicted nucleic acid-binding protein
LFGGHAREILRLSSRGVVINFISSDILREAEDVLRRSKFGLHPEQVMEIISLFKDEAIEELGLKAMDWRFQGR